MDGTPTHPHFPRCKRKNQVIILLERPPYYTQAMKVTEYLEWGPKSLEKLFFFFFFHLQIETKPKVGWVVGISLGAVPETCRSNFNHPERKTRENWAQDEALITHHATITPWREIGEFGDLEGQK